jgi:hypothetical protein
VSWDITASVEINDKMDGKYRCLLVYATTIVQRSRSSFFGMKYYMNEYKAEIP